MKIQCTLIALILGFTVWSQDLPKFGLSGGLLNANANIAVNILGIDLGSIGDVNETGFYIGLLADLAVSEKFHIQPEFTYGSAGDLSFLFLPVMAKVYVANGFHLQAGPQLNYSTNMNDIKDAIDQVEGIVNANEDLDDVLKSFAIDLGIGAGYDINESFMIQARYTFALTDRYDGPLGSSFDIKNSNLFVGLAYFF